MFIGKASSLANPLGMSSYATRGLKPAVGSYVVFSVGDALDYITYSAIDGSSPIVSVASGIATFSIAQVHPLMGIGDMIFHSGGYFFLLSKITQTQWYVSTAYGLIPDDLASTTVTGITKVFSSLYSAFDGGGLNGLLGTYDLIGDYTPPVTTASPPATTLSPATTVDPSTVVSDLQVHIACYDYVDTTAFPVTISSDWITDSSRNIRIYTPIDIKTECNRSQRHNGTMNTGTYSLTCDQLIVNAKFTDIEGLCITTTNNAVSITASGCRVDSCVIYCLTNAGIVLQVPAVPTTIAPTTIAPTTIAPVTPVPTTVAPTTMGPVPIVEYDDLSAFINNIIYGIGVASAGIHIVLADNVIIYCNTVYTIDGTGYQVEAAATNVAIDTCIAQASIAGFIQGPATVDYSLSNDVSIIGGTGNVPSQVLFFRDTSTNDFRLDYRDTVAYAAGNDLSDFLTDDIEGNTRGVVWSIGASQYTPNPKFAIGGTTDLKSGGDVGIVNGLMTFTVAQTSEYITEGMKVVYDTTEVAYLYRKIDTSNWYVISVDGTVPSDIGGVTLNSITPYVDDLYTAIDDNGSGSSQIEVDVGNDLITLNVTIDLILGMAPTNATRGAYCKSFLTDETRRLAIYEARNGRGADATYHSYNSGVFDTSRYYIRTILDYGLKAGIDFLEVDGLQVRSAGDGIHINGGESVKLTRNIIQRCINGIYIDNHDDGVHEISNNIIYRCTGNGIEIKQNVGTKTYNEFGTAGQDLWSLEALYSGDEPNNYVIRVVSGASKLIDWGPNSLTITTDGDTLDNILASAVISGDPWGAITPIAVVTNIATIPIRIFSDTGGAYIPGTYGINNHLYYMYNNTVVKCNNGCYLEAFNTKKSNLITAKNNVIQQCTTKAFAEAQQYSRLITLDGNYEDDGSNTTFSGERNYTHTAEFRKVETDDYHLKLYSALVMRDLVYDPSSDIDIQVIIDIDADTRSSSRWAVAGADHYVSDNVMVYSVGSNVSNLDSEAARPITITNDLLTFGGTTLIDVEVGVGDKITTGTIVCVLVEKGSSEVWRVKNIDGTDGVASGGDIIVSINRCFTNIADAMTDVSGAAYLNTSDLTSVDLNLDISCYNDGGTDGGGTIASFTTGINNRVRIYTPVNILTECGVSQRHAGIFGDGFAISGTDGIRANADYYTVEGMQIDASSDGINLQYNCRVLNNIVKNAVNGILVRHGSLVAGNIVYRTTTSGIALQ